MARQQALDFSTELLTAILWQHDNATSLISLLEQKQAWYDENQTSFWSDWLRDVFDLRTANEFGCQVWSIILGIQLSVNEGANTDKPTWAFGAFRQNFERGNFSNTTDVTIPLTIEQKRLVLRLRYFQLVSRGTVPETNRFLKYIFEDVGSVYVIDQLDMSFVYYVFTFVPSSQLLFILQKYDILPRPAGVGVNYQIITGPAFGFDEYNLNFDHGTFAE
jgi:hypothetical protein